MKTKIILLMLAAYSFSNTVFAQLSSGQNQETRENKWQITLLAGTVEPIQRDGLYDFNERFFDGGHRTDKSFTGGLIISYKAKENFSVRVSSKLTNYNIEELRDTREATPFTASQYDINDFKAKSSVINTSFGVLWSFHYKIINPYGGFQLEYKKYNKVSIDHIDAYYDLQNNFIPSSSFSEKVSQGGGYSIGVGPIVGFSIKACKAFYVGAELNSVFSYYKLGDRVIITYPNSSNTNTWSETNEGFAFSNICTSINVSINF